MVQTSTLILQEITRCSVINSVLLMIFNTEKVKGKNVPSNYCSCWHLKEWAASLGPCDDFIFTLVVLCQLKTEISQICVFLFWNGLLWRETMIRFLFAEQRRELTPCWGGKHVFYEAWLLGLIKIFFVWRNSIILSQQEYKCLSHTPLIWFWFDGISQHYQMGWGVWFALVQIRVLGLRR